MTLVGFRRFLTGSTSSSGSLRFRDLDLGLNFTTLSSGEGLVISSSESSRARMVWMASEREDGPDGFVLPLDVDVVDSAVYANGGHSSYRIKEQRTFHDELVRRRLFFFLFVYFGDGCHEPLRL